MFVLDTCLVFFQSLNGHSTLFLVETRCSNGRIREEDKHDDSPCGAEGATALVSMPSAQILRSTYITINSYFHEGRAPFMFPMPYPRRPPSAIPSPLAVYHKPIRTGCSRRVYHIDVMSIKAGSAQASAAPPKARRTARVLKLLHAAWIMRKTPLALLIDIVQNSTIDAPHEDVHTQVFS